MKKLMRGDVVLIVGSDFVGKISIVPGDEIGEYYTARFYHVIYYQKPICDACFNREQLKKLTPEEVMLEML